MNSKMRVSVVVLAAGLGTRFGHATNKVWFPLIGLRIISRSLVNATANFANCRTILVINPDDAELANETLKLEIPNLKVEIVMGGSSRHESEFNALKHLASDIEAGEINVVLIHDGARPLATDSLFQEIANAAFLHGGAIPAIFVSPNEMDLQTDAKIVRVQTPQAFRAPELLAAYRNAFIEGFQGTDTAACMEKYALDIHTFAVPGDITNIKITHSSDLIIAERVLKMQHLRIKK